MQGGIDQIKRSSNDDVAHGDNQRYKLSEWAQQFAKDCLEKERERKHGPTQSQTLIDEWAGLRMHTTESMLQAWHN